MTDKNQHKLYEEMDEEELITRIMHEYVKYDYLDNKEMQNCEVPKEIDEKCLKLIYSATAERVVGIKKLYKAVVIAAVLALVFATSVFAVYQAVKEPTVKVYEEDVYTAFRISHQTEPVDREETKMSLDYIPEGFELKEESEHTSLYEDGLGNKIAVSRFDSFKKYGGGSVIAISIENAIVSEVEVNGLPATVAKSVSETSGVLLLDIYQLDSKNGYIYSLYTVGVSETEAIKILENLNIKEG